MAVPALGDKRLSAVCVLESVVCAKGVYMCARECVRVHTGVKQVCMCLCKAEDVHLCVGV